MTVYSRKLARGSHTGGGPVAIYTAPVSGLVVVRDIILMHTDATAQFISLYTTAPGGANAYLHAILSASPFTTYHWSGRQVLEASEVVNLLGGVTGVWYFSVSGYEFTS